MIRYSNHYVVVWLFNLPTFCLPNSSFIGVFATHKYNIRNRWTIGNFDMVDIFLVECFGCLTIFHLETRFNFSISSLDALEVNWFLLYCAYVTYILI